MATQMNLNSQEHMWLLPGDVTATVGRLEFLARSPMEGSIAGKHVSPHKGASVEFAEHRPYAYGDDPRDLDWRVYGKQDRYYVKQYTEETNLRATIVLDASGSMAYTGEQAMAMDGHRLSKFRYGQHLAAALTYLLIRQQDAVGLVTFDTAVRAYLPARSRASQVTRVLEELHRTNPGGETAAANVLHEVAERIHRRGLVIIISDLFDEAERVTEALHHFSYRRHEVVVLHVMAEEELTFPFSNFQIFRNLEMMNERFEIDPRAVRARYLDSVKSFVQVIERGCGQLRADYVPMTTKMSFTKALAGYLARRRQKK